MTLALSLSWSVTVEWLKFGGLVVAGLIVAGVLGSLIFAAWQTDKRTPNDIEQ